MQTNQIQTAQPHFSMTVNRRARWPGIRVSEWQSGSGELSEFVFGDHVLTTAMKGEARVRKHNASGNRRIAERTPGHLCLIPSGQPASLNWRGTIECVSVYLEPTLLERIASDAFLPGQVELIEVYDDYDPLIQQIGLSLLVEAETATPAGRVYVDSLVQTLSLHVLRRYSTAGKNLPTFNGGLTGHRLRRVQEFISAHLSEDLSLDELAEAVELSPFHFARAFKRTTGLTPQQYLWQRRIERAKELLADDELPLVEVSALTGFKNQSHFTTLFRKFTSMTPKAWRNAILS